MNIPDNLWAFLMILLGAGVGITAACMGNKDLMALGATVAAYGGGIFHAKSNS